jgi:malonyl-CoA O-methyltransferase
VSWIARLLGRPDETDAMTPELARRIRDSFDRSAGDEEHFPSTIDPRIFHVQLVLGELAGLGPSGRALDLGCGKGRFARIVKDAHPGATVVALDLSEAMLAHAPRDLGRVSASMNALPFADSAFDAAYATESLEHAVDIDRAVAEMCRVVRPGGRIVVIDKNKEHWGRFKTPEWERWFGREELERKLGRHCSRVSSRFISYWEDVEPDGLFVAWLATK